MNPSSVFRTLARSRSPSLQRVESTIISHATERDRSGSTDVASRRYSVSIDNPNVGKSQSLVSVKPNAVLLNPSSSIHTSPFKDPGNKPYTTDRNIPHIPEDVISFTPKNGPVIAANALPKPSHSARIDSTRKTSAAQVPGDKMPKPTSNAKAPYRSPLLGHAHERRSKPITSLQDFQLLPLDPSDPDAVAACARHNKTHHKKHAEHAEADAHEKHHRKAVATSSHTRKAHATHKNDTTPAPQAAQATQTPPTNATASPAAAAAEPVVAKTEPVAQPAAQPIAAKAEPVVEAVTAKAEPTPAPVEKTPSPEPVAPVKPAVESVAQSTASKDQPLPKKAPSSDALQPAGINLPVPHPLHTYLKDVLNNEVTAPIARQQLFEMLEDAIDRAHDPSEQVSYKLSHMGRPSLLDVLGPREAEELLKRFADYSQGRYAFLPRVRDLSVNPRSMPPVQVLAPGMVEETKWLHSAVGLPQPPRLWLSPQALEQVVMPPLEDILSRARAHAADVEGYHREQRSRRFMRAAAMTAALVSLAVGLAAKMQQMQQDGGDGENASISAVMEGKVPEHLEKLAKEVEEQLEAEEQANVEQLAPLIALVELSQNDQAKEVEEAVGWWQWLLSFVGLATIPARADADADEAKEGEDSADAKDDEDEETEVEEVEFSANMITDPVAERETQQKLSWLFRTVPASKMVYEEEEEKQDDQGEEEKEEEEGLQG